MSLLRLLSFLLKTAIISASISTYVHPVMAHAKLHTSTHSSKHAALVIDGKTGDILYEKNANHYRYPASLTKLMTLYLAFEALKKGILTMDSPIVFSAHAASQPKSKLDVKPGKKMPLRKAILSLIVKSHNDVATAIGETLGKTEINFAAIMTKKAQSLGMNHTHFRNASGLHHPMQKTTAYDMARLACALKRDFPEYYPFFSVLEFEYEGKKYETHNHITRHYNGAEGLKTGYIDASGFNIISSAKRGSQNIVAIVMGGVTSHARDQHVTMLMDRYFMPTHPGKSSSVALASFAPAPSKKAKISLTKQKKIVKGPSLLKVISTEARLQNVMDQLSEEKSSVTSKNMDKTKKKQKVIYTLKKLDAKK